jgi:D-galactose 1-dehydrogenase
MAKPTLALVGLGKIAVDQHLPSIAETGLFDLVAIVSSRGASAGGLPSFRTQAALFAAFPRLDAVANCVPPHVRHPLAIEALSAGKHLLIEKPPTASIAEMAAIEGAAKAAGRSLFATWHSRFNAGVDEARAILASRPPRSVAITWNEDVRRWHPGQDWVFEPGGFGVFDPGINALSIVTAIMPHDVFVSSAELLYPANRDTPIAADLALRGPQGSPLERFACAFDWRQEGEQTWIIEIGLHDGGSVALTHGGTRLFVDGAPRVAEPDSEYRRIYRRFAELIATGGSDVDLSPLRIVSDAFMLGRRRTTDAFEW